jgi:hypothetical protein
MKMIWHYPGFPQDVRHDSEPKRERLRNGRYLAPAHPNIPELCSAQREDIGTLNNME